jgi:hypothetical protein
MVTHKSYRIILKKKLEGNTIDSILQKMQEQKMETHG